MKKELFEELKQSLREANLIKRGQLKPGRVFRVNPESNIVRVRGQARFVAVEVCRDSGDQRRHVAELGAGAADADRAGEGVAENCREAS